jgi:hypothetical protein
VTVGVEVDMAAPAKGSGVAAGAGAAVPDGARLGHV